MVTREKRINNNIKVVIPILFYLPFLIYIYSYFLVMFYMHARFKNSVLRTQWSHAGKEHLSKITMLYARHLYNVKAVFDSHKKRFLQFHWLEKIEISS